MALSSIKLLRRLFLPLFSRLNPGDICIKHHWVANRKVFLHSFKHKEYWYHGKNREIDSMLLLDKLIKAGDTVIEAGAHIGYISIYLSKLVEDAGRVYVFEPGVNNLPYTRKNLNALTNVVLVEKAVGNCNGVVPFYIENFSGQNNSLLDNYSIFSRNIKSSFLKVKTQKTMVEVIRLDDFINERNIKPSFIKLDIEGAELDAIKGLLTCLNNDKPKLMVEITENKQQLYDIIKKNGYVMFSNKLRVINDYDEISPYTFSLHRDKHSDSLAELGVLPE